MHPDKTRVMRCHRRQEVTGLTVNERIAVPRDTLRRFRALLHRIETTGPEGKRWGRGGNVLLSAAGFARFVQMVDAKAGTSLVAHVDTLAGRHGAAPRCRPIAATFRAKAAAGRSRWRAGGIPPNVRDLSLSRFWRHIWPMARPRPQRLVPQPGRAGHPCSSPRRRDRAPPRHRGSTPVPNPAGHGFPVRCGGRCWSWRHWAPRGAYRWLASCWRLRWPAQSRSIAGGGRGGEWRSPTAPPADACGGIS